MKGGAGSVCVEQRASLEERKGEPTDVTVDVENKGMEGECREEKTCATWITEKSGEG